MTTTVFQPDATVGKDALFNDASPTTNYETYDPLFIGHHSGQIHRTLIKFTQLSDGSIPATNIIDSATLSLNQVTDYCTNAPILYVYRVKVAWVENQMTWVIWKTGSNWQTGGCDGANDRESTEIGHLDLANNEANGFKNIPLNATLVQAITSLAWTNNGFCLLMTPGQTENQYQYSSSDNATAANRPYITVIHHAAGFKQKITVI
jgi:hypothetical protein